MQVIHPQVSYQDVPPENVFVALDEMGTQVGLGYIVYQYLPHRSPDIPINMYFEINSQPTGWYLILGALIARARQLCDNYPGALARIYTRLEANDKAGIALYEYNGFECGMMESRTRLFKPDGDGRIPMACTVVPTPLNTLQEQTEFLNRLLQNDITHIDLPYLQQLMTMPHFHVLSMVHGNVRVGEVMVAGVGASCEVVAIYTSPMYRRQGMAKMLLHRCMAVMVAEGVQDFSCVFVSMFEPQKRLALDFHAIDLQALSIFPVLPLNYRMGEEDDADE